MKINDSIIIETAVLNTFRLLVIARIILGIAALLVSALLLEESVPRIRVVGLLIFCVLAVYLYSSRLETVLRRFYLPIALSVSILVPIIEQQILLWQNLHLGDEVELNQIGRFLIPLERGSTPFLNETDIWIPLLFIPLVIIAWRYGFRGVIIFCLLMITTVLSFHLLVIKFDVHMILRLLNSLNGQIFVSLAIGYVVAYLNDVEKQQRYELQVTNRKLLQHTIVLEKLTISQERNRLARELHDTLAHTLSGTAVQLEASEALRTKDPAKSQELVLQSLQGLRLGLTETRRALEALRASPLDDLGLWLALHQLVTDYGQRTGWSIELQLSQSLPKTSPMVEQTIYRCAQELLNNIDRHAAASKVEVILNATDELIFLIIRDNGRGFELAKISKLNNRFGIIGMRERVEALEGQVNIDSQLGFGTAVSIEMRIIA